LFADVEPSRSCARYFSAAVAEAITADVAIDWTGQTQLDVAVPAARLEWTVHLESTWQTRAVNWVVSRLPDSTWQRTSVLSAVSLGVRYLLDVGAVGLFGRTPSGHRFVARPREVWMVGDSTATLRGETLGRPGRLAVQASLGDWRLPQQGVFVLGDGWFDDPGS
jgi:hypothetical protein